MSFFDHIERLAADHGLAYLKLGTEAEALSFEEISILADVAGALTPPLNVIGKIGGPEARNDMVEFGRRGATGLVAPMIESAYALRIFLDAAEELMPRGSSLGFNVETAQSVEQLDAMLALPNVRERLSFINVGRSDLAASMDAVSVTDASVTEATCRVIRRTQEAGLAAHVGGCVTAETLSPILDAVRPDGFHTRFLAFSLSDSADLAARAHRALQAEISLLGLLAEASSERAPLHRARIEVTRSRMAEGRP